MDTSSGFDPTRELDRRNLPAYIAIEGPIGVGKTTLAKKLATLLNYDTLLEQPHDNPFLERFYKGEPGSALPAQLFFLFQRISQLRQMHPSDLFNPVHVADFLIEKDPLFAQVTLDQDELELYQQVFKQTTIDAPTPDLVIYLQAPVDVQIERIRKRGVQFEQGLNHDYLSALNDAYMQFFHFYEQSPLLIVNASDLDFANRDEHFQQLVDVMLTIKTGRHYYNPTPAI